jgi:hypothetical protein
MTKRLFIIAIALFSLAGMVSAEWQSLDGTRAASPVKVKVLKNTPQEITLELTIAGYHRRVVDVDGTKYMVVGIPGARFIHKKGFPLLPRVCRRIKLVNGNSEIKVIEKDEVEVAMDLPILPSKGHFTRNIDPATVPCVAGDIYKQDKFWVEKQILLGKTFQMRKVHGARIAIMPISVNHVQMKMKVLKKVVVSITSNGNALSNARSGGPKRDFDRLYAHSFINYEQQRSYDTRSPKLTVIYPTSYAGAISTWATHREANYDVTLVALDTIGSSNTDIKTYLEGQYNSGNLDYVVLVGDSDVMPTNRGSKESAHSDRLYVEFTGDLEQEAIISRLSGTPAQVEAQLAKILAYENATPSRGAILIGSNQGDPTDKERMQGIRNGGDVAGSNPYTIDHGGLEGQGFADITEVYNNSSSSANQNDITDGLVEGRAVIFYCGHGSKTSWASSGFSNSNINALSNTEYPVIWSVACVNGAFADSSYKSCFAETWLQKANGGAVAMEAASTNEAWVPPCVKQAGTANAFLGSIVSGTPWTFGMLEKAGMSDAVTEYGNNQNNSADQLFEQCNLFGDCSMIVKIPAAK